MSRLTDVPGSSAYVAGGVVCLQQRSSKTELVGVPAELIAAHGAVSEPVAVALAEGMRARTGSIVAVGITGIAGPAGGTPEKPVGTVAIAVASQTAPTRVSTLWLYGNRAQVKFQAAQMGLDMVRRLILGI